MPVLHTWSPSVVPAALRFPTHQPLQTGTVKDGPADLQAGREVESSDTHPALDPSEQSKVAQREDSGSDKAALLAENMSQGDQGSNPGSSRHMQNTTGVSSGSDKGSTQAKSSKDSASSGGEGSEAATDGFPEGRLAAGGADAQVTTSWHIEVTLLET
jgi:hypothetical protein